MGVFDGEGLFCVQANCKFFRNMTPIDSAAGQLAGYHVGIGSCARGIDPKFDGFAEISAPRWVLVNNTPTNPLVAFEEVPPVSDKKDAVKFSSCHKR